jgi:hypothetical protein
MVRLHPMIHGPNRRGVTVQGNSPGPGEPAGRSPRGKGWWGMEVEKEAIDVVTRFNNVIDSIDIDIDILNVCDIVYNLDDEYACTLGTDSPSCQQWHIHLLKLMKFIRWVVAGQKVNEIPVWVKDLAIFAVTQSLSHLKYPPFCTNYRPDP